MTYLEVKYLYVKIFPYGSRPTSPADGFCHKPETTWGTMNDDVLALLDPKFKRANFCSIILNSAWRE